MKFWPFKKDKDIFTSPTGGEFDPLIWETNTLAKCSLMPFVNRFPDYRSIIDSDLIDIWDCLMTVAMTGVAVHNRNVLSDPHVQQEIKSSLNQLWHVGAELFDDYYEYVAHRTAKIIVPWNGVSAVWVADNFRLHSKANAALKQNAGDLDFINRISAFMNMSFGSTDVGLSHYLGTMALEVEKDIGIDMGLGTKGTKKDSVKKLQILAEIFESYARKTVDLIAAGDGH